MLFNFNMESYWSENNIKLDGRVGLLPGDAAGYGRSAVLLAQQSS
jgi:hypothetical protein